MNGGTGSKIKRICFVIILLFLILEGAAIGITLYVSSFRERMRSAEETEQKEWKKKEDKAESEEEEVNAEFVPDTEETAEGDNTNISILVSVPVQTMSLRRSPGLGEDVIRELLPGVVLEWNGDQAAVDDTLFYKVKVAETGEEGYVAEAYCTPCQFLYQLSELDIVDITNALYSYEAMCEDIETLRSRYPDRIDAEVIGYSVDGREIYDVVLGNPAAEHQVMIQAGIHGREYISVQLVMKLLEYYAYYYEEGEFQGITYEELFQHTAFHVVPMANPDGVTISQFGLQKLNHEELAETILQCYEQDKETLIFQEDSYGYMNWADTFGEEGFDRYAEGYNDIIDLEEYLTIWKANANGVDLNNNFDAGWENIDLKPYAAYENYKGAYPVSEPETQALVELADACSYDAFISYHSRGQLIYHDVIGNLPETSEKSKYLAELLNSYNKYKLVNTNRGYKVNLGGFSDWIQLSKQSASCTIELGKMPCPISIEEFPAIWNRNRETWALVAYTLQEK